MKTRILYFALAAAALFSLGACNEMKEEGLSGDRVPLKFSASIGDYAVKATDTSFEQGDEVGLFASAPLELSNEKLTWNGTGLAPAQALYWPLGASGEAVFRAYYPYNAELKALEGSIPFKVNYDQSEYKNYTASDLMLASAKASPGDESVNLVFNHKLSKIAIKVENNTDDVIREVLLMGVKGTALVDATAGTVIQATGDDTPVIHPFYADSSYFAIVPPQITILLFTVTTLGGSTYSFVTPLTELVSGKQSRGTVTLNPVPEAQVVEFELSIAAWEEGGNIRFSNPESGERSGYDIYLINTRERLPMEQTASGEFFFNFPNYLGAPFYVLNENSNYIYGCTLQAPQTVGTWPCVNGGWFQLQDYTGDLNVWFYPDEGTLRYEPVYPDWKSLGEGEVVRGMFSNYYGFMPEITKAMVYEDQTHPGVYRVVTPFEEEGVQNEIISFYGDIVIDASDPEKVYMKPARGLWDWRAEMYLTLFSDVVENGEDGEPYGDYNYGYLKDGVIRLGCLTARYDDGSETVFNTDRAFQLVLPGCKREPVLGFGYSFEGTRQEGDGVYADFILKPYPDIQGVRYMFFSGKPSIQEIDTDIIPAFRSGGGDPVPGLEMGREFLFSIPVTQSGRYTGFFYADAPAVNSEYYRYFYNYFVVEVPGSEFPSESVSLTDAAPSALFPDKAASVHVQFPSASSLGLRAISVQAAQEAGLTEDDYYSYAMAGDFAPGFMSFISDNSGGDLALTGLEPDTDYLILAAGYDIAGNSSWTSATVHTAAEPSWTDFGEGTWTDDSWITGGYNSSVLIRKASDGERYRAVKPYANYWETHGQDNYAGYSDDFEFAFVEDGGEQYIYYLPFRPGYVLPDFAEDGTDNGMIEFRHYNIAETHPAVHTYIRNSRTVSEGAYNIASYGNIVGTAYYYNWLNSWLGWVISMPGYDYTPAPAPAMQKSRAEAAPFAHVTGEHKVLPFKRVPLKLGKPVVTPVNN